MFSLEGKKQLHKATAHKKTCNIKKNKKNISEIDNLIKTIDLIKDF